MDYGALVASCVASVSVTVAGGYIAFRISSAKSEAVTTTVLQSLQKQNGELAADIKAATLEMRTAAIQFAALSSEQAVSHRMISQGMDSLANKQEKQAELLSAHGATIALMGEWLKRSGC